MPVIKLPQKDTFATAAGNEVASFLKVSGPMPVFCNDKVRMFDPFKAARKASQSSPNLSGVAFESPS